MSSTLSLHASFYMKILLLLFLLFILIGQFVIIYSVSEINNSLFYILIISLAAFMIAQFASVLFIDLFL